MWGQTSSENVAFLFVEDGFLQIQMSVSTNKSISVISTCDGHRGDV